MILLFLYLLAIRSKHKQNATTSHYAPPLHNPAPRTIVSAWTIPIASSLISSSNPCPHPPPQSILRTAVQRILLECKSDCVTSLLKPFIGFALPQNKSPGLHDQVPHHLLDLIFSCYSPPHLLVPAAWASLSHLE